ncbi:DUF4344 domain-containing metallopeptidase [Maritalea sp.]|uniref:DUF4344 domain-containing metallopeptidase n=1 Tax=Maritalea sp. TaxID=2003361 RepID=UPI003EF575F9
MKHFGLALGLACGLVFTAPVSAQELTDEQLGAAADFAINATAVTLYHEIGHLLVAHFQLPILGKEEDAADNIATIMMLNAQDDEKDAALIDSANSFFYSNNEAAPEIEDEAFYDVHSLDLQRAFQVICLMVGSDPDLFGDVADEVGIDPERQESCSFDYEQISGNWQRLNETFITQGSNGQPITVSYEEPSEEEAGAAELLQQSQIMETIAEEITSTIELPRAVKFIGKMCGQENAYYDPENEEIVICYEIVNLYYLQVTADMLANPEG